MLNPNYFLNKHNIVLNRKESIEEQIRQMTRGFGVQDSYEGDKPYIFISYAHKDSALVLPAIKALQDQGYPVWYDAGIIPGHNWVDYIADHVLGAALVISFLSQNAVSSKYCKDEIGLAYDNEIPMLTVKLENVELPSGLRMQLRGSQMFNALCETEENYITKLVKQQFIVEKVQPVLPMHSVKKQGDVSKAGYKHGITESMRNQEAEAHQTKNPLNQADAKRREPVPGSLLESAYIDIQQAFYKQTISGYNDAVLVYEKQRKNYSKCTETQKQALADLKLYLQEKLYHDAQVFEHKGKKKKARLLYNALPDDYLDARIRSEKLSASASVKICLWGILIALVYLVAHYVLMVDACEQGLDADFRFLIPVGMMFIAMNLFLIPHLGWDWSLEDRYAYGTIIATSICGVIGTIMDPILWPAVPVWRNILVSFGNNLAAVVITLAWFIFVVGYIEEEKLPYVHDIRDLDDKFFWELGD